MRIGCNNFKIRKRITKTSKFISAEFKRKFILIIPIAFKCCNKIILLHIAILLVTQYPNVDHRHASHLLVKEALSIVCEIRWYYITYLVC